jgi:hypothetical protein
MTIELAKQFLKDNGYIISGMFSRPDFDGVLSEIESDADKFYSDRDKIINEAMQAMNNDKNFDPEYGHTWDTIRFCLEEAIDNQINPEL